MPDRHAELKARLKAEAEAAIEELLANRKAPAEASLADIERVVRAASQKFEQTLTAELPAESAAELSVWPTCPQCGQKMKNKG
jgi:DNA repair exonuclease SbcCD ATPase subunit